MEATFRDKVTVYAGVRGAVAFIFWFVIAFACWIGFQLRWNRRKQVAEVAESEFVAIPICAELQRHTGRPSGRPFFYPLRLTS